MAVNSFARSAEICNTGREISTICDLVQTSHRGKATETQNIFLSHALPPSVFMPLAHSCTIPKDMICVDWKRTTGSPLHLHFRVARRCRGLHVTCQRSNENHSSLSLMATEQREEKKHSREEITDMNHHNALRRLPMNRNMRRWPSATFAVSPETVVSRNG